MSTPPEPVDLDPSAVLVELSRIPECRLYLEIAEERAVRKYLQQVNAVQANEITRLRDKHGDATEPSDSDEA